MKKSSTLKFITKISFLPSICIHRSIILIFIEKKVCLSIFFPHGKYFVPRLLIFISTRILISAMISRLWEHLFVEDLLHTMMDKEDICISLMLSFQSGSRQKAVLSLVYFDRIKICLEPIKGTYLIIAKLLIIRNMLQMILDHKGMYCSNLYCC